MLVAWDKWRMEYQRNIGNTAISKMGVEVVERYGENSRAAGWEDCPRKYMVDVLGPDSWKATATAHQDTYWPSFLFARGKVLLGVSSPEGAHVTPMLQYDFSSPCWYQEGVYSRSHFLAGTFTLSDLPCILSCCVKYLSYILR